MVRVVNVLPRLEVALRAIWSITTQKKAGIYVPHGLHSNCDGNNSEGKMCNCIRCSVRATANHLSLIQGFLGEGGGGLLEI